MHNSYENNDPSVLRIKNELFFEQVKPILKEGKPVQITVVGGSMRPFLKPGERIILKPIQERDLKIGHIVLADTKSGYVMHRIIRIKNNLIWMAGDGNLVQIEQIWKEEVFASVEVVIRNGKQINLQTASSIIAAMFWFLARPFRIFAYKIFKIK